MKKSTIKIVTIIFSILTVVALILSFTNTSLATSPSDFEPNDVAMDSGVQSTVKNILGTVRNVSMIAAVAVIMFVGIKYILGSVEEKAEYKKVFMPLIIGVLLIVSATTIATWIFDIVDTNKSEDDNQKDGYVYVVKQA